VSSFTPKTHSWNDFDHAFEKLNFSFLQETKGIRYYQDPDGAIQTLQQLDSLDRPYVDDKLSHIGLTYRIFRRLIATRNTDP
jgi:hypothetical protein